MNQAQLHLLFNHFPLALSFIVPAILVYGLIRKTVILIRLSLLLNLVMLLFTLPLYFSGEGSKELVEHLPHITHDIIEEHEEIAEKALIASIILGGISMLGLLRVPKNAENYLPKLVLGFNIVLLILLAYTAHLGARISHPELREEVVLKDH